MTKRMTTIAFGLTAALITGCGGGGSSDTTSSTSAVKTGVFTDAPVKGLSYKTATQSGVTDAQGHFKYKDGEIIEFTLGTLSLGQGKAKTQVTPYDITENNATAAANIAAILQNFDGNRADTNIIDLSKLKDHNFSTEGISIAVAPGELETQINKLLNENDFQSLVDTQTHDLISVTDAKNIMDSFINGTASDSNTEGGSTNDGSNDNTTQNGIQSISSEALAGYTIVGEYKSDPKVLNIKKVSYIFLPGERAIVVIDLFDGTRKVLRADIYYHEDGNSAVIMPSDYTWDNGDGISLFAAAIETESGYDKITIGHSSALPYDVTAILPNDENGIDEDTVTATGGGSSTTSNPNNSVPEVPKTANITIYNNLNADVAFGGSENLSHNKVIPVDNPVHCTDYGFTNKTSEFTDQLDTYHATYMDGSRMCLEADYSNSSASASTSYVTY